MVGSSARKAALTARMMRPSICTHPHPLQPTDPTPAPEAQRLQAGSKLRDGCCHARKAVLLSGVVVRVHARQRVSVLRSQPVPAAQAAWRGEGWAAPGAEGCAAGHEHCQACYCCTQHHTTASSSVCSHMSGRQCTGAVPASCGSRAPPLPLSPLCSRPGCRSLLSGTCVLVLCSCRWGGELRLRGCKEGGRAEVPCLHLAHLAYRAAPAAVTPLRDDGPVGQARDASGTVGGNPTWLAHNGSAWCSRCRLHGEWPASWSAV